MSTWLISEQGSVRNGWKALGYILIFAFLALILGWTLKIAGAPSLGGLTGVWVGAALGAAASAICLRLEGRPFSSIGFVPGGRWIRDLILGTVGGILLILLTALVVRGLDGFHWARAADVGLRQAGFAAAIFLGVGFNEEILARGYPFQRLVEGGGPWVGQLSFAAFFALLHWGNPGMHGATKVWATLNIGLAAILLGFCYLRTRSLALPIGMHLGWNWAQGSLLGFGVSGTTDIKGMWTPVFHGQPEWLTGGAFGLEASLPCALICGAAILCLWRWKGVAPSTVAGVTPSGGASTASAS